ncbi:MAG: Valyl-tRNA synthetase [Gemmatimonadetes bacterium]|nr:Valyl-tRNA synthetase [Gemmatimonadota bacterium]
MSDAPLPPLPDRYDPAATEPSIYEQWLDAGSFVAHDERTTRAGGDRPPFTIVIPPPNVTAVLHVGHALNNTVQDVLVRWARMRGTEALWVPGTDHAGIATQNVVEKQLAAEGKTRFDVGREAFVRKTEAFVAETGGTILRQLRALGASADWTRTAYTLSPELSRAVREAFVRLFEKGLIYRGHRVIHWCPRCLTSLSDEEAEFHDETGKLYHISYVVSDDPARTITIATTRPETMLGDVAVAVNPDDDRYRSLIGKSVRLPIVDRDIPVIADAYADPAFGTGVVKITPAHDANDFEVGKRHKLAAPIVIDAEGRMNEGADAAGRVPDALKGMDRFAAREWITAELERLGRLVKVEPHEHSVRHCYRCDTVVEPRLSDQWFVKMAPLAAPALEAVKTGAIRVLPERWEAVYVNWLEGIRDWNISRQLWWGHRIPIWYCDDCDPPQQVHASREPLTQCPFCGGPVRQDEDVLDTWFSSWLWPLSTLGWPDQTPDLKAFYPTDVLVTAPEILFFWVARMIMAGYEFEGRAPFHTVYLHGTVRDANHVKMSKSLGNGVDPLDVIALYGADALRWTLVAGMGLGADVILDHKDLEKSFAPGRNFVTKLWNIGRFLLQRVGDAPVAKLADIPDARLQRSDRWILSRLATAIAECDTALGPMFPSESGAGADHRYWKKEERYAGMRLNEYAEGARRFVWNELADWYLESAKARLLAGGDDGDVARAVLVHAFDGALRLLHPAIPFVTEKLWQLLPGHVGGTYLASATWPTAPASEGHEFDLVISAVNALRKIRSEYNVAPGKVIEGTIVPRRGAVQGRVLDAHAILGEERETIERLTRTTLTISGAAPGGDASAHSIIEGGSEIVVPLAGLVDVAKECARLKTELAGLEKQLAALEGRLANEGFVSRAPASVIEGERNKLAEWTTRRQQLADKVRSLCG